MLLRKASPLALAAVFCLAASLSGCQGEPEPAPTAPPPPAAGAAAAAATPKPAPVGKGGPTKKAPAEVVIDVPESPDGRPQVGSIVIGGPEPAENVTYLYAKPDRDPAGKPHKPLPMPSPSGNASAMPDADVAYVRFVRGVEEERQTKAVERQERLAGKSAADAESSEELRRAVKEARARLARLRARTAPAACRALRNAYEKALLLDGAQAEQDAELLTQAVSAAKAGDATAAKAFLDQMKDPARQQARQDERFAAFGGADSALVRMMQEYPNSPADFASVRFGDNPF